VPQRIALGIADFPNLGDHLALLPLYQGLRERYPKARLLLASRFEMARIALEQGFVDEIVLYRRADCALLRRIRAFHPELAICLRRRSTGARLAFGRASGAGRSLGIEGPFGFLFCNERLPHLADVYRPYRYLAALTALGGEEDLPATVRALAARGSWRPSGAAYLVLAPGGMLEEKQWGPERYARVAARILTRWPLGAFAVLGARELERGYDRAMRAELPELRILPQLLLPDLARVLAGARLVLANDCGPGNLAQMAGVPIALCFGNWDGNVAERLGWWFDRRAGAIALTTKASAPITSIADAEVLAAAEALLADPSASGLRAL
jgi:ADP-heptose:LPS heptosyltransferase